MCCCCCQSVAAVVFPCPPPSHPPPLVPHSLPPRLPFFYPAGGAAVPARFSFPSRVWSCVLKRVCVQVLTHCVNLSVCPPPPPLSSYISVVGRCWIGMVTQRKVSPWIENRHTQKRGRNTQHPRPPFISHVCAHKQGVVAGAWLCSPRTRTSPTHPPRNPEPPAPHRLHPRLQLAFLPLRRLKKPQTVWVPPAARLKILKPGCTLSPPVVMATSSLIATACFHSDLSGLWDWLI